MALYQNEPNPFNQTTQIRFYMPVANNYQFKILDVNGKLLKTINDFGSAGFHQIDLSKAMLQGSGVYYYQLIAGHQTVSQKMILIE